MNKDQVVNIIYIKIHCNLIILCIYKYIYLGFGIIGFYSPRFVLNIIFNFKVN